MTKKQTGFMAVFLGAALMSGMVVAGPLEDARALAAAKKYGEVDAALKPLLDALPPSQDALLLSFDSALNSGRPFTAERRAIAIIDSGAAPPAKFLYEAAEVAGVLGKDIIRRDRLVYFLKVDKGNSAMVREALAALCLDGADAEYFQRYVQQFGAGAETLDLGLRNLVKLRDAGKSDEYLKLLDFMFGKWRGEAEAKRVLDEVFNARRANIFGLNPDALSEVLMKNKIVFPDLMWSWYVSDGGMGAKYPGAEYALKYQEAVLPQLLDQNLASTYMNLHAYQPEQRAEIAKRIWKLSPQIMQATNTFYVRQLAQNIMQHSGHFFNKDDLVISGAQALQLVRKLYSTAPENDYETIQWGRSIWVSTSWSDAQKEALINEFPKFAHQDSLRDVYAQRITDNKDMALLRDVIYNKGGARPEVFGAMMEATIALADKGLILESVRQLFKNDPMSMEWTAERILRCDPLTIPERVAIIDECFKKSGYTTSWKNFAANAGLANKDDPAVKALIDSIKPEVRGTDQLMSNYLQFMAQQYKQPGSKAPDGVHDKARAFAQVFPGTYPGGDQYANKLFATFVSFYSDLCRNDAPQSGEFINVVMPKIGKGAGDAIWNRLFDAASWSGDANIMGDLVKKRFAIEGENDSFPRVWASVTDAKGATEASLGRYYKNVKGNVAADYVWRNLDNWTPETAIKQIADLLANGAIENIPPVQMDRFMGHAASWRTNALEVSKTMPLERLSAMYLDNCKADYLSSSWYTLMLYLQQDKLDQGLARFLAGVAKLPPLQRNDALARLLEWTDGKSGDSILMRKVLAEELTSPYSVLNIYRNEWRRSADALPYSGAVSAGARGLRHLRTMLQNTELKPEIEKANLEGAFYDVFKRVMSADSDGMRMFYGMAWENGVVSPTVLPLALARKDMRALPKLCNSAVKMYSPNFLGDSLIMLEGLATAEEWESVYMLADRFELATSGGEARLARWRSEAASRMPGMYPVSANDPAFPLYVAADELLGNRNPERAWTMLQRHLAVFEKDPLRYPPQFTAWAVEQLRHSRGDRDVWLEKAKKMVDGMLAKEAQLSPEFAGSLMLTRAEIARDVRQFDKAHMEYQSIRNHPVYQKTEAGRKAMFRDVDLMVSMGNSAGAEQTIEQWLTIPEPAVQAQAHYMLARIAFDHQDYEQTRKELEQVFAIDFTHTEARLLHGKWKLATNHEVDETQVLVGTLADRTLIRPGQPLTVTVHDRNLGVAGGGASIPIEITTSVGGDMEILSLYPSARDPFMFSGTIDTSLAAATPSNGMLNVRGGESVTYRVMPSFLNERGLKTTPPKTLQIVDDSAMAVGAAMPDAQEGGAEKELESMLSGASAVSWQETMLTHNVRPGNPVYVAIRDKDRSTTAEKDVINVAINTSSGDGLKRVPMTETEPFSGVFRAAIPTHLPAPLATASDSAAGINPGDTINRRRTGSWKSLSDGRQRKWIDVDTMGSYLISSATLEMANPAGVSMLNLHGRLSDDERIVAVFPGGAGPARGGITAQHAFTGVNGPTDLRRLFQVVQRDYVNTNDWIVSFQGEPHREQRIFVRGVICPPSYRRLRVHLVPAAPDGRTQLMGETWALLMLDGRRVFEGRGKELQDKVFELEVAPEPQLIELFASGRRNNDSFRLAIEQEDGTPVPIPYEWTTIESNPKLEAFFKDKAVIERTDTGFKATFETPQRLRALKWEFVDFAGNDVEVKKMTVIGSDGKEIIPVDSDYSDALNNDTLEVAPGDRIRVTYEDEITSSGDRRIVERWLNSSFHDAKVDFVFETLKEGENRTIIKEYNEAYRVRPGDSYFIRVTDPDMDFKPGVDSIDVELSAGDRDPVKVKAYEVISNEKIGMRDWGYEGGVFYALVKTVDASDQAAAAASTNTLALLPGETVRAKYFDRENTVPGIPVEREARVIVSGPATPEMLFYHTWSTLAEDESDRAKSQLLQIQRRPGNEKVSPIMKDVYWAKPMSREEMAGDAPVKVNGAVPVPISVFDSSRARHAGSKIVVEAVAQSELDAAKAENREPEVVDVKLSLDGMPEDIHFGADSKDIELASGSERFSGLLNLRLGEMLRADTLADLPNPNEEEPAELKVNGNDKVRLRIIGEDGKPQAERWLELVSAARLRLMDSTYATDRGAVHLGDRFFISVEDADRDVSPTQDVVTVRAKAIEGGSERTVVLTETMPHSGQFTGVVRPVFQVPGSDSADLPENFPVAYGDFVEISYNDVTTLPFMTNGVVAATGEVYKGADGSVRMFSKRFRDADQAVSVQFRLAECLFENAKELRKLGRNDKSAEAIAEGRAILETALQDYPGTEKAVEGEYLLGNLYEELASEQKQAGRMEEARPLYEEALARFSGILATWPDNEYASRAQYHKALCLEMLGDYNRAGEEYVKMTYLYPDSPLVGDATIRLATYYYTQEKRYDIAGRIYENFQRRFPTHARAAASLFMGAQCRIKQAEKLWGEDFGKGSPPGIVGDEYKAAVKAFDSLIQEYTGISEEEQNLRAQSMYWAGDVSFRIGDLKNAYLYFKRTTFEYPETEWARRSRGMLLQESKSFEYIIQQ